MNLLQILSLWETLEEYSNKFRDWIFDNYTNPLLWIGIIVGGFLIFKTVYSVLNPDK